MLFTDCPLRKYGPGCVHKCSGMCLGDIACNRTTGKCDTGCEFGYTGELCETGLIHLNVYWNMHFSWQVDLFGGDVKMHDTQ